MSLPYRFSPQNADPNSTQNVRRVLSEAAPQKNYGFSAPGGEDSDYIPPLILKVDGLIKIYGPRRVVDGVSFHVNRGEVVGLLGPNGAGKTTSFRMTCGMIDTNGGVVFLNGKDVTNWPMYRRAKEGGMGYLAQDKSVFSNLTVQDNLLGVMELLGIDKPMRLRRCTELLEKFQLSHLRKNKAGSGGHGGLSGGERRRLEIARALVSDPKIILLDEPFAGIDPIQVSSIQEIVRSLSEEGIAILITDHNVRQTLQITHRSYVIESGRVLCEGTPEEVLDNEEARRVYFGDDVEGIAKGSTTMMNRAPFSSSGSPGLSARSHAGSPAPLRTPGARVPRNHANSRENSSEELRTDEIFMDFPKDRTDEVQPLKEDSEIIVPVRARPQFTHTSNSGRSITGNRNPQSQGSGQNPPQPPNERRREDDPDQKKYNRAS